MDLCRQHSTIRANSCSRPVPLRRSTSAISLPARPTEETIEFSRGSPASELTFSRYGKERVKEWDGRPQKLPAGQIGFGFKAFSGESLPPDLIRDGGRFASRKRVKLGIRKTNPIRSERKSSSRYFRAGRLRGPRRWSAPRRRKTGRTAPRSPLRTTPPRRARGRGRCEVRAACRRRPAARCLGGNVC